MVLNLTPAISVARFFVPAIRFFQKANEVYCLCLSNGNYDGLGQVREKELEKACRLLGFTEPPVIIDHPDLQDGPDTNWDVNKTAEEIKKYLRSKQGDFEIDIIITFDEWGISYHPNHKAVHHACKLVHASDEHKIDLMTLRTVNIFRKYWGYADIYFVDGNRYHFFNFNVIESIFAMSAHFSQWVWFRRLHVLFSRYTWLNSLDYFEHHSNKQEKEKEKKSDGDAKKKTD